MLLVPANAGAFFSTPIGGAVPANVTLTERPAGSTVTVADLANVIAGPTVVVNSSAYAGDNLASGLFHPAPNATTPPGVNPFLANDGVVLTSGRTTLMRGSAEPGYVAEASENNSGGSDLDLDDPGGPPIAPEINSVDSSVLTMTVTPSGSTLSLDYVFGSEEYPMPGGALADDRPVVVIGGSPVCSRVPVTNHFVSTLNVSATTNSAYYRSNSSNQFIGVGMDGLTTVLTCSKAVTPGVPVTVKIAVGDAGDYFLDSGLVLTPGSLRSPVVSEPPPVPVPTNSFTLGAAELDKKKGTAILPVTTPGPGELSLDGKLIKPRSLTVVAGTSDVPIAAAGKAKKALKKRGKANVAVTVTFTPTGGTPGSQDASVKLKRKRA